MEKFIQRLPRIPLGQDADPAHCPFQFQDIADSGPHHLRRYRNHNKHYFLSLFLSELDVAISRIPDTFCQLVALRTDCYETHFIPAACRKCTV